jgi:hypothetical protein
VLHAAGAAAVAPGDVDEVLVRLARQLLQSYLGGAGQTALRVGLEAHRTPGVADC